MAQWSVEPALSVTSQKDLIIPKMVLWISDNTKKAALITLWDFCCTSQWTLAYHRLANASRLEYIPADGFLVPLLHIPVSEQLTVSFKQVKGNHVRLGGLMFLEWLDLTEITRCLIIKLKLAKWKSRKSKWWPTWCQLSCLSREAGGMKESELITKSGTV